MEKKEKNKSVKPKKGDVPKGAGKYNIPEIIEELKRKGAVGLAMLCNIVTEAAHILKNEPTILKVNSPMVVVGDIHGQFHDLLNLFQKFGFPPSTNYLFLGDYVDRVMTLMLLLKIVYPNSIHLLRGNHEGRMMTSSFNFKMECESKYQSNVYELFMDIFATLSLCAVIDGRYFAVHGGLSPKAITLADIQKIDRFSQIPEQGMLCDLLWSDPLDQNHDQWLNNKNRSCSYFYSRNHAVRFLAANALRMIIRGHEVQMKGYKYQLGASNEPLTLTIFSAPRYCDTYKNKGAVAILNGKNVVIQSFKEVQHPFVMNNYHNAFQLSFPVMAAKVTKILSHILKLNKLSKSVKYICQEEPQFLKTISRFESIDEMFSSNVNSIESLMLTSSKTANGLVSADENISQSLAEFLQMKAKSVSERTPVIFGPKQIQFVKIHVSHQEQEPILQ